MTDSQDLDRMEALGRHASEQMQEELAEVRNKPSRREVRRQAGGIAVAISCVAAAVAILVGSQAGADAALALEEASAAQEAQEADRQAQKANEELASRAYEQAQQANRRLQARGESPVPVPNPDVADPADVLAASAIPIVLSRLKDLGAASPERIGQAVADYIAANPQGPTADTLSALLAEYLRDNPPPAGADGAEGAEGQPGQPGLTPPCALEPAQCRGADGKTPTAEDIKAEVDKVCAGYPGGTCKGARGEPPVSWTVTDQFGNTYTCRREPDFNPEAPRYECTAD